MVNTLDQHKVKSNVSMNVKWKRNEMREELMNKWNKNERETKEKFIVILFNDRKGKRIDNNNENVNAEGGFFSNR